MTPPTPSSAKTEEVRMQVHAIVKSKFAGDREAVGQVLSRVTGRSVSSRTVQAWMMTPGRPSSRNCPEWALIALRAYLANPESELELARIERSRAEDVASSRARTADALTCSAVERATLQIEHEHKLQKAWSDASLSDFSNMLFRFQLSVEERLERLEVKFELLERYLMSATSLEQCQHDIREGLADIATERFLIRETRTAIDSGVAEFSHPDGIAP